METKHVPLVLIDKYGEEWTYSHSQQDKPYVHIYKMPGERQTGAMMYPWMIEEDFTRKGRPEPKSEIVVQGKYECAAASLSMLLGEKLFNVKRAMGKVGWRNDDKGASDKVMIEASRLLGRDLIRISRKDMKEGIGPCSVTLSSLNIKSACHAITWNGKEILDPNWGRPGRKFWGCEWAPWTLMNRGGLLLLDKNLTNAERAEYDEAVRAREQDEIEAIKSSLIKVLNGVM